MDGVDSWQNVRGLAVVVERARETLAFVSSFKIQIHPWHVLDEIIHRIFLRTQRQLQFLARSINSFTKSTIFFSPFCPNPTKLLSPKASWTCWKFSTPHPANHSPPNICFHRYWTYWPGDWMMIGLMFTWRQNVYFWENYINLKQTNKKKIICNKKRQIFAEKRMFSLPFTAILLLCSK